MNFFGKKTSQNSKKWTKNNTVWHRTPAWRDRALSEAFGAEAAPKRFAVLVCHLHRAAPAVQQCLLTALEHCQLTLGVRRVRLFVFGLVATRCRSWAFSSHPSTILQTTDPSGRKPSHPSKWRPRHLSSYLKPWHCRAKRRVLIAGHTIHEQASAAQGKEPAGGGSFGCFLLLWPLFSSKNKPLIFGPGHSQSVAQPGAVL